MGRAFVIALTWTAGFVDAVGYLALERIYTANMSGNSVALGIRWQLGEWAEAARQGWVVLMFVCGVVAAGLVIEASKRRGARSILVLPLAFEAALLGAFAVAATPFLHGGAVHAGFAMENLVTAMAAIAMGLQNATVTRVGPVHVYTTHVTGAVTHFGEDFARYVIWAVDTRGAQGAGTVLRETWRHQDFRNAVFFASTWVAFTAGAVLGAMAKHRWELRSLAIPVLLLAVLVTVNSLHPLPEQDIGG